MSKAFTYSIYLSSSSKRIATLKIDLPFVTQRFSDNGVGSREDQGYSPAYDVDEMERLGWGEGVGHQPVEEHPLTQHPRVGAALKVDL